MKPIRVDVSLEEDTLSCSIRSRGHEWKGDEPVEVGGQDTGPTPTELVLSGLGTCTVMTMKLYARRKKWDVRKIEAEVFIEEKTEEGSQVTTKIRRNIKLSGDLDEKQRARLLHIAGLCPVAKMLKGAVEIHSGWKGES